MNGGGSALEEYRQAVALAGTRRAYRLRLAQRLRQREQYYQAMNEWRSVLGQDPGNIEARLGLARAAAKAGDRAAAAQEYLHILRIVPNQPEAQRELGRLGRAGRQIKAARRLRLPSGQQWHGQDALAGGLVQGFDTPGVATRRTTEVTERVRIERVSAPRRSSLSGRGARREVQKCADGGEAARAGS